jgi:hypothetical protein
MRHRLALAAQTLWATPSMGSHACKSSMAVKPGLAERCSAGARRSGWTAFCADWRIRKLAGAKQSSRNRRKPCHHLLAVTCFTTKFAWR